MLATRAVDLKRLLPGLACAAVALSWAAPAQAAGGLQLIPEWRELITLVLLFVFLIYPLNVLIFRPIFGVLDEREERIVGARRRGEQLERDAAEVMERYEAGIRDVRAESELARRETLDTAREQRAELADQARGNAESEIDRGRTAIASSLEEARGTLRGSSRELAQQAAERILGRPLS